MVKSIVSGLGEMRKDWQKSGCNTRYNSYKLLGGLLQNPEIDNPEYTADPNLYKFDDIGAVGFETEVLQTRYKQKTQTQNADVNKHSSKQKSIKHFFSATNVTKSETGNESNPAADLDENAKTDACGSEDKENGLLDALEPSAESTVKDNEDPPDSNKHQALN